MLDKSASGQMDHDGEVAAEEDVTKTARQMEGWQYHAALVEISDIHLPAWEAATCRVDALQALPIRKQHSGRLRSLSS
jgi:hypothetical protein